MFLKMMFTSLSISSGVGRPPGTAGGCWKVGLLKLDRMGVGEKVGVDEIDVGENVGVDEFGGGKSSR
jgi:hypothetical protein